MVIILTCLGNSGRLFFSGRDYPVITSKVEMADEKIDLNSADFASLSRLPLMGNSRVENFIDYRNTHQQPGEILFTCPQDVMKIKGIGSGMLNRWQGRIIFPVVQKDGHGYR